MENKTINFFNKAAGIIAICLAIIGYKKSSLLGMLTGFISSILLYSSLQIFFCSQKQCQKIGGFIGAILITVSIYYTKWKYGWLWSIISYIVGITLTIIIAIYEKKK